MSLIAELRRRDDRLRSLSSIGTIDGGEGWGEGVARQLAAALTTIQCIPLTQPSPPSMLGGDGLKHRNGASLADGRGTL